MELNSKHKKSIYRSSLLIIIFHVIDDFILIFYTSRIRDVINNVLERDINNIVKNLILYFALFILKLIINWITMKFVRWAQYKNKLELRTEFLGHLNAIYLYKLDEYGRNNISNRYEKELNAIITFYTVSFPNTVKNIVMFILIGVYAFQQSYILFILLIIVVVLVYIISRGKSNNLNKLSDECAQLDVDRNTIEYDILSAQMELSSFRTFHFILTKVRDAEEKFRDKNYKLELSRRFFWGFSIATFTTVNIAVLSIGSLLVLGGHLTFGSIISLLTILDPIVNSMFTIQNVLTNVKQIKPIIERFNNWQWEQEEIIDCDTSALADSDVLYKLSDFSYSFGKGSGALFNHVNLSILRNQKYLLVGKSGSGKSTLLRLLTGYDNRYTGALTYKGVGLNELGGPFMRTETVLIENDVYLIAERVQNLFKMMYPEISDSEITGLLKMVELSFPLEQIIEKGGSNISGGEKQRLCLALILAAQRKVMLMDECLSMIPLSQQIRIMKRIFDIPDVTFLWTDHRVLPGIIELFDKIILFDDNHVLHCNNVSEMRGNELFTVLLREGGDADV